MSAAAVVRSARWLAPRFFGRWLTRLWDVVAFAGARVLLWVEIAPRPFEVESPPNKPMQPTGVSVDVIRQLGCLVRCVPVG